MEPLSDQDDWEFCEAAGLIFCVPAARALDERSRLLQFAPDYQPWHLEGVINHEHLAAQTNREDLRGSVREAEVLAAALRRAFPERRFVIVNRLGGEVLSFYQAIPGAPTVDPEPVEPQPERAHCPTCDRRQAFQLHPQPDPEFPELEWADCAVCGQETWLWSRSRFTTI